MQTSGVADSGINTMSTARNTWQLDALTAAIDLNAASGPRTHEVAGVGSRGLAAVMDLFILLVADIVAILMLIILFPQLKTGVWLAVLACGCVLWDVVIFAVCEIITDGQTPGKNACGLKVISADGQPANAQQYIIRNLLRIVDFLPGFYGVGVGAMLSGDTNQRLGDRVAGTLVIYDASLRSTLASANVPDSVYSTSEDGYLLEAYLVRRSEFREEVAIPLARQLADYFYRKYPPSEARLIDAYSRQDYVLFLAELYDAEKRGSEA